MTGNPCNRVAADVSPLQFRPKIEAKFFTIRVNENSLLKHWDYVFDKLFEW
jgi:hypothetical protein